jgi:hypothetical protein
MTTATATSGGDSAQGVALKVSSQTDIVMATLVGAYDENGIKHGRKFYQKIQRILGYENVNVCVGVHRICAIPFPSV